MESEWRLFLAVFFALVPASIDSPPVPQTAPRTDWDAELLCLSEASEGAEVIVLEWNKDGSDDHVLFYRNNQVQENYQDQTFKNRVELRDPELGSGDMSIRLKNISSEDSGVYRCRALIQTSDGRQEVSQSVHLTVTPVKPIVAQSGEDRALPCASPPGGAAVLDVRWSREGSDGHVLLYRDGRLRDENQNQMFKNRVELRDPQLRSGDMTLRLKNISSEDSGVYQCHFQIQTLDGQREEHTRFVQLKVRPGVKPSAGKPSQTTHLLWWIFLALGLVLSTALTVLAIARYRRNSRGPTSVSYETPNPL